jgi:hypothetical protein
MLNKIKNNFNLIDYKKAIGTKTNIHKVSYFFKEDFDELHNKKLLIFDLEFSMNKFIFEVGGLVLDKGKVKETFFQEFKIPDGEPYWSFESNSFISKPINQNKNLFSKKDRDWLFEIIEEVDYVIVHNYPAEAQCIAKLKNKPYNALNCSILQNNKFICTNYSFKNKYFKNFGIENTSNSDLSNIFGWKIEDEEDKYNIKNEDINFFVKKPKGVESKLHNSFYDSVITLTNLISLKKIIN